MYLAKSKLSHLSGPEQFHNNHESIWGMMKPRPEIGGEMHYRFRFLSMAVLLAQTCVVLAPPRLSAQNRKVMGEVRFRGAKGVDRDSGVWIDGQYVGYVKELKDDKKVMLLPGKHEISVRQAGYADFVREIVVEPGRVQLVRVAM